MSQQRRPVRIPEIGVPSALPADPREAIPAIHRLMGKIQIAFREVGKGQSDAHGSPLKPHADTHLPAGDDPLDTGTPSHIALANTAGTPSEGTGDAFARYDHGHGDIKRDVRVKSAGVDVGTRNAINIVSGATVTDNPGSDRVDITITPGASALDDLTDVDLTSTPPVAGNGLVYDGAMWVPGAVGGGGSGGGAVSALVWNKYTVPHADVAALGAVASGSVVLASLPAKTVVHGALQKTSTAFSGGTVSAASSTVGVDDPTRAAFLADADIVAQWPLDEASGTRFDAGPNGLDLTDVNTVTQAAGKIGQAAFFTAANSEALTIADNAHLSMNGKSFAFLAWVNPTTNPGTATILAKRQAGGSSFFSYILRCAGGTTQFFISDAAGANQSVSSVALTANTWNLVAAWVDFGGATVNLKVNDNATVTAVKTITITDDAHGFAIGSDNNGGDYWDGRIDDVWCFKRALTAGDLTAFYNVGSGLGTGLSRYAPAYDLMAAVSGTNLTQPGDAEVALPHIEDYSAATDLKATFTATGDTLSNVAAGSLDVWALTSTLLDTVGTLRTRDNLGTNHIADNVSFYMFDVLKNADPDVAGLSVHYAVAFDDGAGAIQAEEGTLKIVSTFISGHWSAGAASVVDSQQDLSSGTLSVAFTLNVDKDATGAADNDRFAISCVINSSLAAMSYMSIRYFVEDCTEHEMAFTVN